MMLQSKLTIGLNIYHVIIDGLYDAIPIFLAFIVLSLGTGERDVGSIISLIALFSTLASLGTVYLSERFGLLNLTALIVFLYGAGYMVAAFSSSLLFVGASFVVATLGHQLFHNISFTYFSDSAAKNKVGRAISDFTAIGDIGRIPFISLAGLCGSLTLYGFEGWRVFIFLYGAGTIVFFLLSYPFVRTAEHRVSSSRNVKKNLPSLKILADKRVMLTIIANMLNVLSCGALFVFLPLLLLAKGFDPKILGGFGLGFSIGCFLGKIACGRLIDRYGSSKIFIASHILLTFFLLGIISTSSLSAILAISLAIGFVTKGSIPTVQTILIEYVPSDYYNDIFSLNSFFRGIIMIIIPFLYGLLSESYGITHIYSAMAVFSVMAIIPILAIPLVKVEQ